MAAPFGLRSSDTALSAAMKREAPATRILTISDYEGLRTSREQVLRVKGYQVESVPSSTVFDGAWVRTFDIAILCQSVDPARAAWIAEVLHGLNPGIALLRISVSQASLEPKSRFDFELEGLAGPQRLLKAVELIGRRVKNGRRAAAVGGSVAPGERLQIDS